MWVFFVVFLLHMDTLITKRLLYHFGCAIQRDRRLIAFKSHVPCPDTALADPRNGYGWNVPVLSLRCSSISLLSSSAEECTQRERRTVCSHLRVTDTLTTLFFAFSPPEYLWWYPVFNFPPHWPWGIFNAVAQHRLMLHCNSVSVSLCKRRVGFQRGENRWL